MKQNSPAHHPRSSQAYGMLWLLPSLFLGSTFVASGYASLHSDRYFLQYRDEAFLLEVLQILLIPTLLMACTIGVVVQAIRRRWGKCLPPIVAALLLVGGLFSSPTMIPLIDYARFQLFHDYWVSKLDAINPAPAFRLAQWGAGLSETQSVLVYDETINGGAVPDNLAKITKECAPTIRQLEGHFYIVRFRCD